MMGVCSGVSLFARFPFSKFYFWKECVPEEPLLSKVVSLSASRNRIVNVTSLTGACVRVDEIKNGVCARERFFMIVLLR